MDTFSKSIPPLLVAGLGVGVGWLLANGVVAVTLIVLASFGAVGFLLRVLATQRLPLRPRHSRTFFEWSLLGPATLAVLASGFLLWFAIASDVPQGASAVTKKTVGALAAAVTAAVTTSFIKGAEEADEMWVARAMRSAFRTAFDDSEFPLPQPARTMVFSAAQGWSLSERKAIANAVENAVRERRPTSGAGD